VENWKTLLPGAAVSDCESFDDAEPRVMTHPSWCSTLDGEPLRLSCCSDGEPLRPTSCSNGGDMPAPVALATMNQGRTPETSIGEVMAEQRTMEGCNDAVMML